MDKMKSVTFFVGGDLAPTRSNYLSFEKGDIKSLVDGKLLDMVLSVDFRIFNLETPLTDTEKSILKDGPSLIAPARTINGIKALNPSILVLANNHILDQDEQGLNHTFGLLEEHKILKVGAGVNLEDASKPLIVEKNGHKIGIYACAENEFTIAGKRRGGANPFDPLESPDHISKLKEQCGFVLVLHHGGKEHYRYPSPDLRKVCRKMAEKGADLIVCQHSHCIGAFEKYGDSIIVYGQGNFLFDRSDNEFRNTGLLLKVTLDHVMTVDFLPVCKKRNGVELPSPETGEAILKDFHMRSNQIMLPGFVENEFRNYCILNGQFYLATLAGFGRIVRNIDKLLNGIFSSAIYSQKKMSQIQNHVECESQRELLLEYLRIRRGENNN